MECIESGFSIRKIFVICEWKMKDSDNQETSVPGIHSNLSGVAIADDIPGVTTDEEEADINEATSEFLCQDSSRHIDVVTFKCIGVTRKQARQDTLESIQEEFGRTCDELSTVPVRIRPERDNPVDARALAFECYYQNSWKLIGYVVKELIDEVNTALEENRIMLVKFAWVRYYLRKFRKSGPGFFAGIDVHVHGSWSRNVLKYSSIS